MPQAAAVEPAHAEVLMGKQEAKRLTADIKRRVGSIQESSERLREAVHRAHREGAWKVLGYESWSGYVAGEFPEVSRGQKYRLVAWGEVVAELEEAAGGPVSVSGRKAAEARARADEVADEIRERLAANKEPTAEDRQAAVDAALAPPRPARERTTSPPAARQASEEAPEPAGTVDAAPEPERPAAAQLAANGDVPPPEPAAPVEVATSVATVVAALLLVPPEEAGDVSLEDLDALAAWIGRVRFVRQGRPRARAASAAKPAAPAKQPAKAKAAGRSDCRHPVNRRIMGRCAVCGDAVT